MKPKWQKGLTKKEIQHIRDTTETGSLTQFRRNRKWQKEKDIECWDCKTIERKINEYERLIIEKTLRKKERGKKKMAKNVLIPKQLAEDILEELKETVNAEGRCDHSVGICICELINMTERLTNILDRKDRFAELLKEEISIMDDEIAHLEYMIEFDPEHEDKINRRIKGMKEKQTMKEKIYKLKQEFCTKLSALNGLDINDPKFNYKNNVFYNVYYRKNPTFMENPKFKEEDALVEEIIGKEYVHVSGFWEKKAMKLDEIWKLMQGEVWSPEGEARELIELLGLKHTSMSVGDLIEDHLGIIHEVAMVGFNNLF